MIPSLVSSEVRKALVDYLATTFALADDDVSEALAAHLTDPRDGMFRGPYLRVRTPFRSVDANWKSPLGWSPDGFVPYEHQATAFERLSSTAGRSPLPTLVTTGTGSGKTECFLMPVLDHCARQRAASQPGIKALILYPMNALATDQAGRLAAMIKDHAHLSGITAGIYIGENGSNSSMGDDHLIDDRHALRASPPDILLTNYKMLDFLLLRRADHDLWATNTADSLRYVVLDEFHTYDGAQGTDVAMLLRRLGATLGMTTADRPLGGAAPVATSATLGSEPGAIDDLREFAGKVFGVAFDADSVIGETRQSVDEACGPLDPSLPVPAVDELLELPDDDLDATAAAFCRKDLHDPLPADPVELGRRLLAHPLTRAVLTAVADRPRPLTETVGEVVSRVPGWEHTARTDRDAAAEALARYLALLSVSRRKIGDRTVPLFSVEVQLWVREISRLLRSVDDTVQFRWMDTPAAALPDIADADHREEHDVASGSTTMVALDLELPSVYCRMCGHAGWMALASELHDALLTNPANVYRAAFERAASTRTLMRANPSDPSAVHLDPAARRLTPTPGEHTVAVYVTPDEDAARQQRCPACGERDAVRFIGLAVASLASVSINTMFGSHNVGDDERKLLAFTDSVQDASHRAAFFGGRTHRFNMRSLISASIQAAGPAGMSLADLGDELMASAVTARERFGLVPPDLQRDVRLRSTWSDEPEPDALEILTQRVGFEVDLEFGLRSRVGRTLAQSVAAAARVDLGDAEEIHQLGLDVLRDELGDVLQQAAAGLDGYLVGLADRLRSTGAIHHPLLDPYVREGGKQWQIWGGRPPGLPPFTPDQGRPTFVTTATKGPFDSVTALATTPTWLVDWGVRSLGLEPATARSVNQRMLAMLAEATDAVLKVDSAGGQRVFGLDRRAVRAVDIDEVDGIVEPAVVRCDLCSGVHTVAPIDLGRWIGVPCRRYRCPGRYQIAPAADPGYYRRFYRQGQTRRVVTGEHTGLLNRKDREALETAFKDSTAPDAPNVLTATPTLEMGIDIGDLSAVMLTSVPRNPASYIQRVGRAGRATGNALVTTFVRSDTHGLYYLAEPEAMLAGAVRPPNCYLEATETLRRHYVAYLVDRIAERVIDSPPVPERIGDLMRAALEADGLFRVLIDHSTSEPNHAEKYLALFGSHLGAGATASLREFAGGGIEPFLKDAVDTWFSRRKELDLRRDRLNASIKKIEDLSGRTDDDDQELRSLKGQRSAVIKLLRAHRDEYWVAALERLGILPNYTLVDDSATLSATLWSRDGNEYSSEVIEYARRGRVALQEFAPGNTFYAGGHRHRVDALEIGSAQEPLYETWRICPECTYAGIEPSGDPPASCPRCGGSGIADLGARHTVLRLRTALASGSEESARVYDESDERRRERYELTTLVDPDPAEISGAWLLEEKTFGAELCTRTHLRTLNLGISGRPGESLLIGGVDEHISRFSVCRMCGAVRDARDDQRGSRPERLHQGWCRARSGGASKDPWDSLVLLHELTTEAIRFLVPVSMFEVDERLASFKAALLLGIRAELGGNPDHLTITAANGPNRGGQGRRRFLVLYDEVPGGTGYLGPLADPTRIRDVLVTARTLIARCPCRAEARPACHRCLLGVVDRWEYDLVSRGLAKEILDALLDDWEQPKPVDTIGSASIAKVEESELERRFKVALREWAESDPRCEFARVPGRGKHEAFDLSIRFGGEVVRYRIAEQEGITSTPSTQPDFVITRMDADGPKIAVYLDGFQYHASTTHNAVAQDAAKRAGVRAEGMLVWNLTWTDVEAFHKSVTAEIPREPPDRTLLDSAARAAARRVHHARGDVEVDVGALEQNPVAMLLDFLVRPQVAEWRRAVLSAVAGAAASVGARPLDAVGLAGALDAALAGGAFDHPEPTAAPVVLAARYVTPGGLPLSLFLDTADPADERWTVIAVLADDGPSIGTPDHALRWSDWLPWANLLQFLGQPHDSTTAVVAGASQAASSSHDDLWLRHLAHTDGSPTPPASLDGDDDSAVPAHLLEELDLLTEELRPLVRAAVAHGFIGLVAGHEVDGSPLEAAWPDQKVAVMWNGQSAPPDWAARHADEWTVDDLLRALSDDSTDSVKGS